MGFVVCGQQLVCCEVRIFLGRPQRGMAQHFLNGSQIRPLIEQMRGKRVAQCMWTYGASRQADRIVSHNSGHASRAQPPAALINKHGCRGLTAHG